MKRMGNNQWPLMFGVSLDGGRTSEKWLLDGASWLVSVTIGYVSSIIKTHNFYCSIISHPTIILAEKRSKFCFDYHQIDTQDSSRQGFS